MLRIWGFTSKSLGRLGFVSFGLWVYGSGLLAGKGLLWVSAASPKLISMKIAGDDFRLNPKQCLDGEAP